MIAAVFSNCKSSTINSHGSYLSTVNINWLIQVWAAKIQMLCNCFSNSVIDISKINLSYLAAFFKINSYDYEKLPDEKVFARKTERALKQVNWQKKPPTFLYAVQMKKMPFQGFSYFLRLISGQGKWKHLFQLNSRKQTEFISKGEACV